MDTKSIGSKLIAAISVLLVPILLAVGVVSMSGHMPERVFRYFVLHEKQSYTKYTQVNTYLPDWSAKAFYSLEEAILALEEDTYSGYYRNNAARMKYYAKNLKTGKIITNCEPITYEGEMTMDEISIICNQASSDWVEFTRFDGKQLSTQSYICSDRFSEESWDEAALGLAYKPLNAEYAGTYEIAFAFSRDYAYNGIALKESYSYTDGEMRYHGMYILTGVVLIAIAGLLALIFLLNRKGRKALGELIGKMIHWLPLELKGVLLLMVGALFFERTLYYHSSRRIEFVLLTGVFCWIIYALLCDIRVNRSAFLKRSIVYSIFRLFCRRDEDGEADGALVQGYGKLKQWYHEGKTRHRERMQMLPYQKRLHRALIGYFFGMFGCFGLCVLLSTKIHESITVPLMLVGMAALTYWLYRRYVGLVTDIERIAAHIRLLRSGSFDRKLTLSENSQLYSIAADLNNLQDGLKSEIDKRMVSEKMKVELITNVSHDLKTPLTSMINYIDLLKEEELEPEYTRAYVQVLDQKSQRLKLLIENIFDISKATSGNMMINYERLNMTELVNQTLAECENRLELAELSIKKNYTDEKFYVYADGKMLWRITENILNNAVKYSLKGTRIYLELTEGEEYVSFTVKNIAGYEMDFTSDSIVERFVRGDESRTTEGTGLGLSIVKSFIEAMGGRMTVTIDGDLFKITVCIKRYKGE